jgi:mono/diheme cytochrome c family protein
VRKLLIGLVVVLTVVIAGLGAAYWQATSRFNEVLQMRYNDIPPVSLDSNMLGDVALGERIVTVRNGCIECHGKDLGGATVINDPAFAIVNAPNITPFKTAEWTDGEIARSIRHGIGKDGEPLLLMPSHEYFELSKSDLQAIVAYLRQIPAVERPDGGISAGPVMKMLYFAGKIPTLFPALVIDHDAPFNEKPEESDDPAFGKYLVETSCTGCHGKELQGGPIVGGDPSWPPAAPITKASLSNWSLDDFRKAMKSGVNPSGKELRPPMPIALTSQLSESELIAIYSYLVGPQ